MILAHLMGKLNLYLFSNLEMERIPFGLTQERSAQKK